MAEQEFKREVGWGSVKDDFQGESELMVTITLHEYRSLVTTEAQLDYRIEQKNQEISEIRRELDEANRRVDSLLEVLNGDDGEEAAHE